MEYDDFTSFMRAMVLPRRAANPEHVRLDGRLTGGSRRAFGRFRYNDASWVVHEDTHYEPLLLANEAAEAGQDPFVETTTKHGRCLELTPVLRKRQQSRYKYLYAYHWAGNDS